MPPFDGLEFDSVDFDCKRLACYLAFYLESIYSLFNIQFNQLFITKLQEINAIYGQQQLENIKNTLGLIRELKMLNIEYNLLNYNNYNGILKYLNISNKIYT